MTSDLLIISGCTGVGKTAFSLNLAKHLNIEIVSADSIQIYKSLDIGTSKLTPQEASVCPHHMIDIISPFESYNVFQYVKDAKKIIADIWSRGALPVVVGGTGLYIESLIKNYSFKNDKLTEKMDFKYKHLCLFRDRQKMYKTIDARVDKMMEQGLVKEVETLHKLGIPDDAQCMQAIGYKEILEYLNNEISLDEAVDKIKQSSRNYAKRQLTWFRHMDCEWVDVDKDLSKVVEQLCAFYDKYKKTQAPDV